MNTPLLLSSLLFCVTVIPTTACWSAQPEQAPEIMHVRKDYEKPKTVRLDQALEKCLSDAVKAQQELHSLFVEGKVSRERDLQGFLSSLVKFPNGFYSLLFSSEAETVGGFKKRVFSDDSYVHEISELGYDISYDDQGKMKDYRKRGSHEGLILYPDGGLKRFWTDIDDRTSAEVTWDISGKLQSESTSAHPPRNETGLPELETILRHGDSARRREAVREMVEIGPASIPYAVSILKDGDVEARDGAAFVLGLLRAEAGVAVPDLARQLRSDESTKVQTTIARSLGMIGAPAKAAIPVLEEAATNANPEVADAAKSALSLIRMP